MEIIIQAIRIFPQDIGMESSVKNYSMFIIKSGRRQTTEGIELTNQEESDRSEKRNILRT